jgi:hypothetical protein
MHFECITEKDGLNDLYLGGARFEFWLGNYLYSSCDFAWSFQMNAKMVP